MGDTASFLRTILPDFGWYCLFVLPDKKHLWFTDIDQMAKAALRQDALGKAVFYGCASFSAKKRKKEHVAGLKIFWLDIDAGPGKPYPDPRTAMGEVETWRRSEGFPLPLYVVSGGGIHAYWPLRDALDRVGWQRHANCLRTLAQSAGLKIDPGITIDEARVMRPPGTNNRKIINPVTGKSESDVGGPARPVYQATHPEPYDTQEILRILSVAPPATGAAGQHEAGWPFSSPEAPTPQPINLGQGRELESALLGGTDVHDPSNPDDIAANCGQVSLLRSADLPEPLWYAVLAVLAHAGPDGVARAHLWSSRDSRYSEAGTRGKIAHALASTGPTTCARFQLLNPEGCEGCQYKGSLTSPIQLGRGVSATLTAPKPDSLTLPQLPDPYKWANGKLKVTVPKVKDGEDHDVVISDYPIYVQEFQRGERSEGVSAVFRLWEPVPRQWREFSIPLREILGDKGASLLAHYGSPFAKTQWGHFQGLVIRSNIEFRGTQHYRTRYEQFGWKTLSDGQPGFAIGEELILKDASIKAFGSVEFTRRGRLMATRGSLAGWRSAAESLFRGNHGHAFALLCGFASVLYSFTNAPGGSVVHLRSPGSGTGKTTVLEAAATIWGSIDSCQVIERDTTVAKFISIGTLCHLPVVFDELRARDPEIIKEQILHYTLGRDKHRGATDGGLRTDDLPWSNILLSASNLSLTDTVGYDGTETAHAARIFEYRLGLDRALSVAEGEHHREQLRQNCGTAGRAFIARVLGDIGSVRASVQSAIERFGRTLGAEGDMRYTLRLLACVAVAGALCEAAGIVNLNTSEVLRWALSVCHAGGIKPQPLDTADIVGRLINDLLVHTLVMPTAPPKGPRQTEVPAIHYPRGELLARYEVDTRRLWLDENAVKKWLVKNNYAIVEVRDLLTNAGVLLKAGEKKTLAAGSNLPKAQVRTWEINGSSPLVNELVEGGVTENVVPIRRSV